MRTEELRSNAINPELLEHRYEAHLRQYDPVIQEQVIAIDDETLAGFASEVVDRISLLPTDQILTIDPQTNAVGWSEAVSFDSYSELAGSHYDQMRQTFHDKTRRTYVYPEDVAGTLWKHRVENAFDRHRLNGVLFKIDEACRKGDFSDPHLSLLIARLPVNDKTAHDVSNLWLLSTLTTAGKIAGRSDQPDVVARYSRVYSALCDQTPNGVARPAVASDGIDKNFHQSKATTLKIKQMLAEQQGLKDVAEIIEQIGASFYPLQRNSASGDLKPASLRDLRSREPRPDDLSIKRHAILSDSPAWQALTALRMRKGGVAAATAATAIGITTLLNPSAAAAASPDIPSGNLPSSSVIDQMNSFLRWQPQPGASSITLTVNAAPQAATPTYDVATRIQATTETVTDALSTSVTPAVPLANTATIENAIATTTVADTSIKQVDHATIPVDNTANKTTASTPEDRLRRLANVAGVDAVTAGITNAAPNTAPAVATINPLLNAELTTKLQTFNSELASANLQPTDADSMTVRIAQLTAALQNPSTLDAMDDQTKQQLLTGANTAFASIFKHQSDQLLATYAAGKYGSWAGFTDSQQKIIAGLVTTVDLSLMNSTDLQNLINTIIPPTVAPAAPANQTPAAQGQGSEAAPTANALDQALSHLESQANWKNRIYLIRTLLKDGFNLAQASGIVGNLEVEAAGSDLDPTIQQFGGGPGRGIAQWGSNDPNGDRFGYFKQADGSYKHGTLRWYADQHGLAWDTIEAQAGFLVWEIDHTQASTRSAVLATSNAYDAATAFMNSFERPAVRITGARGTHARHTYSGITQVMKQISSSNATKTQAPARTSEKSAPQAAGKGELTTNTAVTYPGVDRVLAIANNVTNENSKAFRVIASGANLHNECDHLATALWGYSNSGYNTAKEHWDTLQAQGKVHTDRQPPVGAFVFYDNGMSTGHVATYLGNGKVLSNDVGGTGTAAIVDASEMETGTWHLKYLGWTDPIAQGGKYSSDTYQSL